MIQFKRLKNAFKRLTPFFTLIGILAIICHIVEVSFGAQFQTILTIALFFFVFIQIFNLIILNDE